MNKDHVIQALNDRLQYEMNRAMQYHVDLLAAREELEVLKAERADSKED